MKKQFTCSFSHLTIIVLFSILIYPIYGYSADLIGTWKAEFETQIGLQKYVFTFSQNEKEITGIAISDVGGEIQEVKLTEIKLDSSKVSFVEVQNFQDMELRISYQGIISENEIKFTRNVGDFATEEFIAKREETTK